MWCGAHVGAGGGGAAGVGGENRLTLRGIWVEFRLEALANKFSCFVTHRE